MYPNNLYYHNPYTAPDFEPSNTTRRGPWSPMEDKKLMELIEIFGATNWVRISLSLITRTPKQCRERYHQNLKPSLNRTAITNEEGELIESLVLKYGRKWAEISRHLNGRSDNAIKNWWNGGANRRRRQSLEKDHLEDGIKTENKNKEGELFGQDDSSNRGHDDKPLQLKQEFATIDEEKELKSADRRVSLPNNDLERKGHPTYFENRKDLPITPTSEEKNTPFRLNSINSISSINSFENIPTGPSLIMEPTITNHTTNIIPSLPPTKYNLPQISFNTTMFKDNENFKENYQPILKTTNLNQMTSSRSSSLDINSTNITLPPLNKRRLIDERRHSSGQSLYNSNSSNNSHHNLSIISNHNSSNTSHSSHHNSSNTAHSSHNLPNNVMTNSPNYSPLLLSSSHLSRNNLINQFDFNLNNTGSISYVNNHNGINLNNSNSNSRKSSIAPDFFPNPLSNGHKRNVSQNSSFNSPSLTPARFSVSSVNSTTLIELRNDDHSEDEELKRKESGEHSRKIAVSSLID